MLWPYKHYKGGFLKIYIYAQALTLASRCSKSDTNKKIKRKVAENEKKWYHWSALKNFWQTAFIVFHVHTLFMMSWISLYWRQSLLIIVSSEGSESCFYMSAGWQKLCEGRKGLRRKVWSWTKILQHTLFCRDIKICHELRTSRKSLDEKMIFWVKTVFLGQAAHYYMVYFANHTDLNLQICNYAQKSHMSRK